MAEQIKGIAASPEILEATLEQVRQQVEPDAVGGVKEADVAAALVQFNRLWDTLTSGEKSRIFALLLEHVVYD